MFFESVNTAFFGSNFFMSYVLKYISDIVFFLSFFLNNRAYSLVHLAETEFSMKSS